MKQIWIHIKQKIAEWLLSEEVGRIRLERETYECIRDIQAKNERRFEEYKKSLTVADMVREQLKGLNKDMLLSDDYILDLLPEEEVDGFLSKAQDLKKNPVFRKVIDIIKRDQTQFIAQEALTIEQLNFGRATINGVSLFEEAVDGLVELYLERHEVEGDYDKHSAI
jgi:hypothetical protein